MQIAIVCNDTRGGVQPYKALGLGLARAGHKVRIVAPSNYAKLFGDDNKISYFPLSGPPAAEVNEVIAKVASKGTFATMMFMAKEMPEMIFKSTAETLEACEGVDLITGGVGGMVTGVSVADKLGVPFVQTHLQPVAAPTCDYPGPMFGALPDWIGGPGRLASHYLSEEFLWMPFRGAMAAARSKVLGLNSRSAAMKGQPIIYGLSRKVVPMPYDKSGKRHTTGYWIDSSQNWNPPEALQTFLNHGDPVVSIGFGSMSGNNPDKITELLEQVAHRTDVRILLLTGNESVQHSASQSIFHLGEAPHEWLFPRVSAIVHHGGAGTTAAALRSGVPNIVVPFGVDQPFWGARVKALGVGPDPIPRPRLSAENLSAAILTAIGEAEMKSKASLLGYALQNEDGVTEATKCFEKLR